MCVVNNKIDTDAALLSQQEERFFFYSFINFCDQFLCELARLNDKIQSKNVARHFLEEGMDKKNLFLCGFSKSPRMFCS